MPESQKYLFVLVRFMECQKAYAYLCSDPNVCEDDVVIVPTPRGRNYGIVERVLRCDEKHAPYPPERTKYIAGIAGHKLRQNRVPEKPNLFVSNYTDQVGTPAYWLCRKRLFSGTEYECSYCKYCYDHSFPICPNCHKHMSGQPSVREKVKEMAKVNSEITAVWLEQEHLFGEKTYLCTNCDKRFKRPMPQCPQCGARVSGIKADPVWVDAIALFDEDF